MLLCTKMIEVALIDPPLRPMRIDTLGDGLDELIEDIQQNGQLQNIVVVDTENERYRLVAGSRRCAAFEEACWPEIRADVHKLGTIDEQNAMAAENLQRTQLNPIEEACFYRDYMADNKLTAAEAARRTKRSVVFVKGLLDLLAGDPKVMDALRAGAINKGQAEQLNLVRDEIGRHQGLEWAKLNLMTAKQLHQWRENREVTGQSDSIEQVKQNLAALPIIDYRTMAKCILHNDYVELVKAPPRIVCDECWNFLIQCVEFWKECNEAQEDKAANGQATPA